LKIAKVAEPEEVAPGGEFTITLTLSSASAPIEDVTITDILPNEDFQYQPDSAYVYLPGQAGVKTNPATTDGLTLVWDLGGYDLPPHSQVVVTFTVKVDSAAEYGAPLPDTRLNNAEGYGKWCPLEGRPCFELKPTAFDNMRVVGLTGSIKVCKSVDWKGTTPVTTTTFKICVKPVGGTAEQCKDVDFDGGSVGFYGLAPGSWLVYEKAVMQGTTNVTTQWVVTGNNQTVQVPAACPWVYIKNTKKVGTTSIVINKVVDWGTATPDPTKKFTICVTGVYPTPTPAGRCQQVGYTGGPLTWYGLPNGTYKVVESPHPGTGWTVSPASLTLTVPTSCVGTIKNTLSPTLPGSLEVTKSVILNGASGTEVGATTFSICIQGPSYPTTPNCKTIDVRGGTLLWTNLKAGSYTVTETNPGSLWSVAITGSPANVPAGAKAYATVTNTRKKASLEVTKKVDWNGETPAFAVGFTLCIAGPSYPSPKLENGGCQMVHVQSPWTDAGTGQNAVTWTNLVPGDYTVLEVPSPGWVVKVIDPPGGKVAVAAGALAKATVTNTRVRGRLQVTKVVDWRGTTPDVGAGLVFGLCIVGPSYPSGDCKEAAFTAAPWQQTLTWDNLKAGDYAIKEKDPGQEWIPVFSSEVVKVGGDSLVASATVTNRRKLGGLEVTKEVLWNGVPKEANRTFVICISQRHDAGQRHRDQHVPRGQGQGGQDGELERLHALADRVRDLPGLDLRRVRDARRLPARQRERRHRRVDQPPGWHLQGRGDRPARAVDGPAADDAVPAGGRQPAHGRHHELVRRGPARRHEGRPVERSVGRGPGVRDLHRRAVLPERELQDRRLRRRRPELDGAPARQLRGQRVAGARVAGDAARVDQRDRGKQRGNRHQHAEDRWPDRHQVGRVDRPAPAHRAGVLRGVHHRAVLPGGGLQDGDVLGFLHLAGRAAARMDEPPDGQLHGHRDGPRGLVGGLDHRLAGGGRERRHRLRRGPEPLRPAVVPGGPGTAGSAGAEGEQPERRVRGVRPRARVQGRHRRAEHVRGVAELQHEWREHHGEPAPADRAHLHPEGRPVHDRHRLRRGPGHVREPGGQGPVAHHGLRLPDAVADRPPRA
ncbi:MAG: hypothetical protein MUC67_08935, partial [Acidobacteria bacterium]|nr:hypothetical protein [Acidobacteriota bacterium]MCU0479426.1 hypothetical protein [Chloroflexota bacterium]